MYSELTVISVMLHVSIGAACLYLDNLNLVGGTFDEIDTSSKQQCCIACTNHNCCLAYTFSKETNRCYLKSSINYSEKNSMFHSGVKANVGGKAAILKNVEIQGVSIEPVQLGEPEDCKQYCTAFGTFSWSPATKPEDRGKGSCSCIKRVVSMYYKHGCQSYVSPPPVRS